MERYLATRPGRIGIVLHDRVTGATWANPDGDEDFPAASTVKLAMVTDLLLRNASGRISLDGYDWELIDQILADSSDAAGDDLWYSFEDGSFLSRIRELGMRTASFSSSPPYWGYMYCSARDLDNLMNYVLGKLPAGERGFLVRRMRRVAPIQQWGVWGAGRRLRAGDKDGWEDDKGVWIVDTVGFAGPDARYSLAVMDDLGGAADFHEGATTVTDVASLLFRGRLGPAPTAEATP